MNKKNINENNNNIKVKKYLNLINKNQRSIIINNNINNNFLDNFQNYQKTERDNIIFNQKSIFNQGLKSYNTVNENLSINNSNVKYNNIKSNFKNFENLKNTKTIDNSSDTKKGIKNNLYKKLYKNNIPINKIYKTKKISYNNSLKNINQYQNNTSNSEKILNDIRNNMNNINKTNYIPNTNKNSNNLPKKSKNDNKKIKAYLRKSPGKIHNINNSIDYNTSIERNLNYDKKPLYNKDINKIINYDPKNIFNYSYNTGINPNNISGVNELNLNNDIFFKNKPTISNINKVNNNWPKIKENTASIVFNLEDLIVLEERLNGISLSLNAGENIENNCFNFWNYYYNCSLFNVLEKIFKNKEELNIVKLSINYELMSIMVCYEYSFVIYLSELEVYLLLELIDLNYDNLIIICEYILKKIVPENKQNIWVLKLKEIIQNSKLKENNNFINKNYSEKPIEKINFNINLIIKKLKNILLNYPTEFSDILISLLKKVDTKTYDEINTFFRENILRVDNYDGSIIASSYIKKNKYFKPLPAPYLTSPPNKPYTLVLDLDETLVYFKIKSNKGGTLRARPYLFGFLEEMGHYYELIIWTSATEKYANSLIDAIEYEKKYFDYVLYREHSIIVGDDFVKDLTRIGRDLGRIIIIDDMPQNFRFQKDNGITIKPFFGDDLDDSALYELVPILKHIAESGKDVRFGLDKYKEEIVNKVTSNSSRKKIY